MFSKENFIIIILSIWALPVEAQVLPKRPPATTDIPLQSLYLELGGIGSYYSANYDVTFESGFGFRIGGSYIPEDVHRHRKDFDRLGSDYHGTDYIMILLMGNYLYGKGPGYFEFSTGLMIGEKNISEEEQSIAIPDPPGIPFSFGYRYLPDEPGKMTFKIAFTPVIADGIIYPKVGVSVGFVISQNAK